MICSYCCAVEGGGYFSSLCMKSLSLTLHLKATEQYVTVVLFITLYTAVLMLEIMLFQTQAMKMKESVVGSNT